MKRGETSVVLLTVLAVFSGTLAFASDHRVVDAMKNKNAEAVRALIKEHADVNGPAADGSTALHWAVHWDDIGMVDLLLGSGAQVNAANDYGVTPVYLGCINRNSTIVARLLKAGADPTTALPSGETVLMACARTGDTASVQALLARGADANAKERLHQQTALMWAAAEKHPDTLKALLNAGARVESRSRIYTQTVSSTLATNRPDLAFTVRRGGSTALLFAARVGDINSLRFLVDAGANVNDTLADETSAVCEAAFSGHAGAAAFLVENGADPNRDGSGFTALHAAVLRSQADLVRTLLAHGANRNAPIMKGTPLRRSSTDYNLPGTLVGATPYLLAAKFLEVDIMRSLLDAGADSQMPMKDGTTPLMAAAGVGARPNQNRRGRTTIDGATLEEEERVVEAVKTALRGGADVNAVNAAGDTALHGAVGMGYDRVVQLLADNGAKLDIKNKRGQTPLSLALVENNNDQFQPRLSRPATAALLRKLGAIQ
jgi:uncharacterized protein